MLETELDNSERDENEPVGSGAAAGSQQRGEVPGVPPGGREPLAIPGGAAGSPGPLAIAGGAEGGQEPRTVPAVAAGSEEAPAGPATGPATQPLVPAATFQPPQVIFQPPAVPPVVSGGEEKEEGTAVPESDAEADGNGRRRRRRGGRGRGKGGEGADGGGAGGTADDSAEAGDDPTGAAGSTTVGAQSEASRSTRTRRRGGAGKDREAPAPDGAGDETAKESASSAAAGSGAASEGKGGTGRTRRSRTARTQDGPEPSAQSGQAQSGQAQSRSAQSRQAQSGSAQSGLAQLDTSGGEYDDGTDDGGDGESAATRRRRRRRRRGGGGDGEPTGPDDPPNTVVHVREPRAATATDWDEVQSVKGSTRLEAKKQRRREGRDSGRRRPPVLSESEFLARREAVQRVMLVRQKGERTQIAVLEDGVLVEHYVDRATHQSMAGNIYLGKVQNVLPSMEAAFVDIGKGRNAVLYAGEINFDASGLEGQPKRIEMVLKSGQSVLVQVTKDPVGHKGARLTNQVSLPGRYLVYVPGASMTGISRKLPVTERTRLKQILKKVTPENAGVIVRTAAEGTGEEELARDVARLAAQWENIERKATSANPPELLYSEPDLTIRVVRDIFNEDFGELVVAGDDGWDTVNEYVRYVAPHLADRLRRWEDDTDVFASYRIDEQLAKALERKVWLPSGGSLVIDRTEAMTVIDVNTGKFTGQGGNLEETVTRNNLEAAEEIVRQLRLRDIGGIIVIDFIDMVLESNRELVLRRVLECLARDRTKHQVAEVTSLGLVQMTRKRVGSGLLEAFSEPCECCNGRGLHVSADVLDGPSVKRPQPGRGGGTGETKGQGDGQGQGDGKGQGDSRSRGDSRGQGDARGQLSGGGDNGRRHGAAGAGTGATLGSDDGDGARGGDGNRRGDGGRGGESGRGGGAIAEGPRGPGAHAEDKPTGRRRRRRQAASPGGRTDAFTKAAGTDTGPDAVGGANVVVTPASEAAAAAQSEPHRDSASAAAGHAGVGEPASGWQYPDTWSAGTGPGGTGPGAAGSGAAGSGAAGSGAAGSGAAGQTGAAQPGGGYSDAVHAGAGQADTGHADAANAATGSPDVGTDATAIWQTVAEPTAAAQTAAGRLDIGDIGDIGDSGATVTAASGASVTAASGAEGSTHGTAAPGEPGSPWTTPGAPVALTAAGALTAPGAPATPDVLTASAAPATPDVLTAPATPDVLTAPATPDVLTAPATPDVLTAPAAPATPAGTAPTAPDGTTPAAPTAAGEAGPAAVPPDASPAEGA